MSIQKFAAVADDMRRHPDRPQTAAMLCARWFAHKETVRDWLRVMAEHSWIERAGVLDIEERPGIKPTLWRWKA